MLSAFLSVWGSQFCTSICSCEIQLLKLLITFSYEPLSKRWRLKSMNIIHLYSTKRTSPLAAMPLTFRFHAVVIEMKWVTPLGEDWWQLIAGAKYVGWSAHRLGNSRRRTPPRGPSLLANSRCLWSKAARPLEMSRNSSDSSEPYE